MDVKSTFLNGDLKEEVHVRQPAGFIVAGQEGKVLRLRKVLYGLGQAPRAWNSKLDNTLKKMNFIQSEHEHAMYRRSYALHPPPLLLLLLPLLLPVPPSSALPPSLQSLLPLARIPLPRQPRPPAGAARSRRPSAETVLQTWCASGGLLRGEEATADELLLVCAGEEG
jgi:hypothetical protein